MLPEDAQAENEPTVSVVIAAYNAAETLGETLASVLGQTWRDYEVIVVDDGSTDATAEVAEGYGEAVRLIRKENGGSASARNAGIRAARGRYVAFLDADDLWLPEKLERQMRLHAEQPDLAWSYTDAVFFDDETGEALWQTGRELALPEGDVLRPLFVRNAIAFSSAVVRRSVLLAEGGFDTSALHRISEDWDLWLRLAREEPVGVVRAPLVRKREHRRQKTATMDWRHALKSRLRIAERAAARDPERLTDLHAAAAANLCLSLGRQLLNREARADARAVLWRGLRHRPTSVEAWTFWLATFVPRPALRVLSALRRAVQRLNETAFP